ncbi:hypothetical protein BDV37DRAFT_241688 [Aspergillus pseudonomiae]|uniref:Uncharacterized protein n=1 Tax=Aspergillus pseudonomiae TaxID=1506151 RepID=A0A5N7DKN0_9EURO|nr:uncharacterized protein BDV37DRAFT_241688 [Aspergillus pseudonomiae]KAE8407006.1 hypothetical protein BDV37DRAFT_241688 [Aspergillus pseudonomiae]
MSSFLEILARISMSYIPSLPKSWRACFPYQLSRLHTVISKYWDPVHMTKVYRPTNEPVRDIIEAEKRYGISFFNGY